jgi:hypothetical protein
MDAGQRVSGRPKAAGYLRDPRCGFFSCDCRAFIFLRLGLLITNVPLPRYSALKSLSSAKNVLLDVSSLIPYCIAHYSG